MPLNLDFTLEPNNSFSGSEIFGFATVIIENSIDTEILTKNIPNGQTEVIEILNNDATPFENYEIIDGAIVIITNSLTDNEGITLTDINGVILTT